MRRRCCSLFTRLREDLGRLKSVYLYVMQADLRLLTWFRCISPRRLPKFDPIPPSPRLHPHPRRPTSSARSNQRVRCPSLSRALGLSGRRPPDSHPAISLLAQPQVGPRPSTRSSPPARAIGMLLPPPRTRTRLLHPHVPGARAHRTERPADSRPRPRATRYTYVRIRLRTHSTPWRPSHHVVRRTRPFPARRRVCPEPGLDGVRVERRPKAADGLAAFMSGRTAGAPRPRLVCARTTSFVHGGEWTQCSGPADAKRCPRATPFTAVRDRLRTRASAGSSDVAG
ncbi:hypothetical protein OH77DRAFT_832928 [Trametes cingulata]|nr:hypothetical protein OH77DRAFT_832928 [Trametes cingulata]